MSRTLHIIFCNIKHMSPVKVEIMDVYFRIHQKILFNMEMLESHPTKSLGFKVKQNMYFHRKKSLLFIYNSTSWGEGSLCLACSYVTFIYFRWYKNEMSQKMYYHEHTDSRSYQINGIIKADNNLQGKGFPFCWNSSCVFPWNNHIWCETESALV